MYSRSTESDPLRNRVQASGSYGSQGIQRAHPCDHAHSTKMGTPAQNCLFLLQPDPLLRDPGDPCLWEVAGKGGPGKSCRPPNPSPTSKIREVAGADQANTFTAVQILRGEESK